MKKSTAIRCFSFSLSKAAKTKLRKKRKERLHHSFTEAVRGFAVLNGTPWQINSNAQGKCG